MTNPKVSIRTFDGLVFCFLASVVIAVAAFNIGFVTEAGKILPAAISMRSGETNSNIIRGIDLALEDIKLIKSGAAGPGIWRLLTFIHLDLFFYLALLLPETAAKTVLLIGYYIKFGLCCSAMYYFLSEHIKLKKLPSALLASLYAFSSQIIFTAQFASVMNMAIMIPVLMSAFNSYLRKRTWRSFSMVCLCSFGMAASGGFGIITGIPAMVFISLLMCISLYQTFKMAFTSWLRLLAGMVVGLILDMVFALPGLTGMETSVNIKESFSNARVTYKVFDLLRGTFALRSGSIYTNGIPIFYIGILTIVCIVVFAVNEQIPVRVKTASAVIVSVFHITCCSSFVNEVISIFGDAPMLIATRLICLEAVLFFIAAIGLRNVKSLKHGGFIAACLIPMFILVVSGVSSAGTSLASPILIATFIGIIIAASVVNGLANDRFSGKKGYALLIAFFILVGVNTAFVMFNNTISKQTAEEYFTQSSNDESDNIILDNDFDLPALGSTDTYMIIPADLSIYEAADSSVNNYNYLSQKAVGEDLFVEADTEILEEDGLIFEAADVFRVNEGLNKAVIIPNNIEQGERLFVYCNSSTGASIDIHEPLGDYERSFTGPFLTEIRPVSDEISFEFSVNSESDERCRIAIYRINEGVLERLKAFSGNVNDAGFKASLIGLDRASSIYTLILPYSYDDDIKVKIGKEYCDKFNFCGKMAVTFECGIADNVVVVLEKKGSGIVPGAVVSAVAAICLVAIPFIQRYNSKKKVSFEGNDSNA